MRRSARLMPITRRNRPIAAAIADNEEESGDCPELWLRSAMLAPFASPGTGEADALSARVRGHTHELHESFASMEHESWPDPHPVPSPEGRGGVIVALRATALSDWSGAH